ncbi:Type IV prepilin peptidase TadV/CpaA [hydrothermal vent metagenome]|uniref:Type IV prepilin peptidase TadV/CpaA n=1 Tax=hydrothermal vent metagenome TaxID=652676 RepID=A0A3B0SJC5_9ZZZZ
MNGEHFIYLLWGGLAIALIVGAVTDIKRRQISNKLNLLIALGAPLLWIASDMQFWPEMVQQIGVAAIVLTIFGGLFAVGAMGGGDVKMLAAIALWLHWLTLIEMIFIMSIAGGVLTLLMMIGKRIQKTASPIKVPYGVAISFSGLWIIAGQLSERYFNHFT